MFNTGFLGRNDIIINVCVKNDVLARFIFYVCFMFVEERNFGNNLIVVLSSLNNYFSLLFLFLVFPRFLDILLKYLLYAQYNTIALMLIIGKKFLSGLVHF